VFERSNDNSDLLSARTADAGASKGDRMSDAVPVPNRLPARPSLEQLRKRAKERLEILRADDPSATLSDAQLALAREYGFDSWPKLVHHVEGVQSAARLDLYEKLANDYVAAYAGDGEALDRLGAHYGASYNREQLLTRVRSRVDDALGTTAMAPSIADAQLMLARQFGFESWAAFAQGLSQPDTTAGPSPIGLSATPPFYRIDWNTLTIEPHPPVSDRDWASIFAVMREHRLTGINSAALTDSALRQLAELDWVTRVNMDGAQRFTDDGLLSLAKMPQLEELDVSGWHSPMTDRGLAVVRELRSLRRFQASWPQQITDAGTSNLTFCDKLESVNLMGTHTGDGTINALRGKERLHRFQTGKLVTDAGIPLLHDFPMFKTWASAVPEPQFVLTGLEGQPNELMLDGPFTDAGLARLAGLNGLFRLSFFWHAHAFTSDGLASLATLPHLGALGCEGVKCDDAAMRHIAAIPRLRALNAQGTIASDDGFVALSKSQSIEVIWGRECPNLRSRGFAALASMPALRGLSVSCLQVDDAALALLPSFPSLTFLTPIDVQDAGFQHVGRCEKLTALWCMYCRETGDQATEHIARLPLQLYYAGKTKITDASLAVLGGMQTLERIELWQTAGVTDAGVAQLATLPRLRELAISGVPRVTRRGVSVFPPRVRVDYGS
jgi:hypothetical protein